MVRPRFLSASSFSEGLALVEIGKRTDEPEEDRTKWRFIGRDGKFAFRDQFDFARPFSGGLALAAKGGKFGFIDHSGSFVIKPQFRAAKPFSGGLACVGLGERGVANLWGYVDRGGRMVIAARKCLERPPAMRKAAAT